MDKKQKRFNISFKENEKEIELYNWIKNKSDIAPISTTIKELLYKAMKEEVDGRI